MKQECHFRPQLKNDKFSPAGNSVYLPIADLLTKVSGVVSGNGFFPEDPGMGDHGSRHTGCDQIVNNGLDFRKFRHGIVIVLGRDATSRR